ncbi:MAG: DUF1684 domain-containing protein [Acidobacteriota bacterium]
MAAADAPGEEMVDAYRLEVEEWRSERDARLRSPDGWLTLAGLHWLERGRTAAVGARGSVELPTRLPPKLGEIRWREGDGGERAVFVPQPGIEGLRVDARPLAESSDDGEVSLRSDATGPPTRLSIDGVIFHLIERGDRVGVRVKDAKAPIRLAFRGIDNYPIDPDWRRRVRWEPTDGRRTIQVPNVLGTPTEEPVPGQVVWTEGGRDVRLDALEGGDENEIFVLFTDATNGAGSYPGGRFLYALIVVGDLTTPGEAILDFNRAYNPPCAFTRFATCPLPPPQNDLPFRVEAGEKAYSKAID